MHRHRYVHDCLTKDPSLGRLSRGGGTDLGRSLGLTVSRVGRARTPVDRGRAWNSYCMCVYLHYLHSLPTYIHTYCPSVLTCCTAYVCMYVHMYQTGTCGHGIHRTLSILSIHRYMYIQFHIYPQNPHLYINNLRTIPNGAVRCARVLRSRLTHVTYVPTVICHVLYFIFL